MQTVAVKGFDEVVFGNPLGCDSKDGLWVNISGRWYKLSANCVPAAYDFPVTPAMIKSTHFTGKFGRMECEHFAAKLVRYAQALDGWCHFCKEELDNFEPDPFNGENLEFFVSLKFLAKDGNDYWFTHGFIMEVLSAQ